MPSSRSSIPNGTLVGTFTGQGSLTRDRTLTGTYEVQVLSADNMLERAITC